MKMYLVNSYNNGERSLITKTHGLYDNLTLAQEAIPKVWYAIFKDGWGNEIEPTVKNDDEWIQKWGRSIEDGGDGYFMNGYVVSIVEVELNKTYEDIDPQIYNPYEERLKELK